MTDSWWPIVVVGGVDERWRAHTWRTVRRALCTPLAPFGFEEVPDEDPTARAVMTARTTSLLASRRVVALRDPARREGGIDPLVAYLADPSPDVCVLVEVPGRVPAALERAVRAAGGRIHVADPPAPPAARRLVQAAAAAAGIELTPAAITHAVARLGAEVDAIDSVCAALAVSGPGPFDVAAVDAYLPGGALDAFTVLDAVSSGDAARALDATDRCLRAGTAPLALLAVARSRYQRAWRVRHGASDGRPADRHARRLEQALAEHLEPALELIADADGALKGRAGLPASIVCEVLVARLARLHRLAARRTRSRRPSS